MCRTTERYLEDNFPLDQLLRLHKRKKELPQDTAIPCVPCIPNGCGILLNLAPVGIFPTARWLTDPTMPPDVKELFGGTPFFALGAYRVAHLDVKKPHGTIQRITLVVNSGVPGMNLGFWGGAFSRCEPYACLARFECIGEMESSITENSVSSCWFQNEYEMLEFPHGIFQSGMHPGVCKTQFEKLLGTAIEFMMTEIDWESMPQPLVEITDMSRQLERKLARRRPHARNPKFKVFDELPPTE